MRSRREKPTAFPIGVHAGCACVQRASFTIYSQTRTEQDAEEHDAQGAVGEMGCASMHVCGATTSLMCMPMGRNASTDGTPRRGPDTGPRRTALNLLASSQIHFVLWHGPVNRPNHADHPQPVPRSPPSRSAHRTSAWRVRAIDTASRSLTAGASRMQRMSAGGVDETRYSRMMSRRTPRSPPPVTALEGGRRTPRDGGGAMWRGGGSSRRTLVEGVAGPT